MQLPNFIIIGAEKSGTTSLYYYLQQHPEIFMSSIKETRYFCPEFYTKYSNGPRLGNRSGTMSFGEYQNLFADANGERAVGEASPQYIYIGSAAGRIKECLPEAKLIAILRNPVERAYSAYCYQLRGGYETLSFRDALVAEAQRKQDCWRPVWCYKDLGLYYSQIKTYVDLFSRDQLRVYLYEDLSRDALTFMQGVYSFLEVDPTFAPDITPKNVSGVPKNRFIHTLLNQETPLSSMVKQAIPKALRKQANQWVSRRNLLPKPEFPEDVRQELQTFFREDILKLQDLLQQDLNSWLT